jgi:hypothetical protein|nr:MAG TPA: hypothetical protein [Caudoviricetes sp.]
MFRKGLEEEFNAWLDNTKFNSEVFDKVNDLTDADKNYIINAVLDDEQLTQEMFNCFEWYLNRYLEIYKESD